MQNQKNNTRKLLEQKTTEYLAKGGEIKVLDSVERIPLNHNPHNKTHVNHVLLLLRGY